MNITKSLKLVGKVFEKIPITDIIFNKLPESVDEAERERIRSAIREAEHNREMGILDIFEERDLHFTKRVQGLEGTSGDLQQAGWPCRIVLFFRGVQRPFWGFVVLFMNYNVYVNGSAVPEGLERLFTAVTLIIVMFLFGERAIKNVFPLFDRYFGRKSGA